MAVSGVDRGAQAAGANPAATVTVGVGESATNKDSKGFGIKEIAFIALLALGVAFLAVGIWAFLAAALPPAFTLLPGLATLIGLTAAKCAFVGVGLLLAAVSSYFLFFQKKNEEAAPALAAAPVLVTATVRS